MLEKAHLSYIINSIKLSFGNMGQPFYAGQIPIALAVKKADIKIALTVVQHFDF